MRFPFVPMLGLVLSLLGASVPQAEELFVATSRASLSGVDAVNASPQYYLLHDMEVLPGHQPARYVDEFVSRSTLQVPTLAAFARQVVTSASTRFGTREVVVLVHGYNTTYWTSQMRATQLAVDLDLPASMVLFSWPNAHSLTAYNPDLARASDAQSALETLLQGLTAGGASRIVLIGHSLGAHIAMETLAQMRQHGNSAFFAHFGGAVLLSPDMPMTHFKSTLRAARTPVVIYSSGSDWALDLAAGISDKEIRVGSVQEAAAFEGMPLIVVDTTSAIGQGIFGHYAIGDQPSLMAAINAMSRPDLVGYAQSLVRQAPAGDLQSSGNTVIVRLP